MTQLNLLLLTIMMNKQMYRYWRIFNNVITRDPRITNVYFGVTLFIAITIVLVCLQIIGIGSTWYVNTEYNFKTGACEGPWFCDYVSSNRNVCGQEFCAQCSGHSMISLIGCGAVGIITCFLLMGTLVPLYIFVFVLLPFLWRFIFGILDFCVYCQKQWEISKQIITTEETAEQNR